MRFLEDCHWHFLIQRFNRPRANALTISRTDFLALNVVRTDYLCRVLNELTAKLNQSGSLDNGDISMAIAELIEESVAAEAKADFLGALANKGETTEEIAAFARELREKSIEPPIDPAWRESHEILDVCGTGGDQLHTFNISTTVAIVVASGGVPVAKHGNRAITSKSGSADVLEALGIKTDLPPDAAARSLEEHHFAFFFAPNYHPAFKHILPARKLCAQRGQRTIFNFLGPLLNPARPTAQLIGVPRPRLCDPLARVLQSLGIRRGMVVCGNVEEGFLDELSTLGDSTVAEFYQAQGFSNSILAQGLFPLQPAKLADLAGGDPASNAATTRALLSGEERGPKRDAVLLNAGAALFVAGHVKTLLDGWNCAAELIDSGTAADKLRALKSIA